MLSVDMIPLLRCPGNPSAPLRVEISKRDEDRILEGHLISDELNLSFPIHNGVPNLMPPGLTDNEDWQFWKKHLQGFDFRREARKNDSKKLPHPSPRATHSAFFEFAGIDAAVILDVGCGPGKLRHYLNEERVTYYGLDPLPMQDSESFRFVYALGEYIPFADSIFTHMMVISALDHFKDLNSFFREAKRVLRDDGTLLILQSIHEVNGPISLMKVLAHLAKDSLDSVATKRNDHEVPKHMNEFSQRSLTEVASKYFKIERIKKHSKNWYSPEKLFVALRPTSVCETKEEEIEISS